MKSNGSLSGLNYVLKIVDLRKMKLVWELGVVLFDFEFSLELEEEFEDDMRNIEVIDIFYEERYFVYLMIDVVIVWLIEDSNLKVLWVDEIECYKVFIGFVLGIFKFLWS